MSSGRFHEDKLGFTFEVNHQRKQLVFSVGYLKDVHKIYIRSATYEFPERTTICSEHKILIEPEYAMILFNDKFWEKIPEIMKNISEEMKKKDSE